MKNQHFGFDTPVPPSMPGPSGRVLLHRPDSLDEVEHPDLIFGRHVPALGHHHVGEEAQVLAGRGPAQEDDPGKDFEARLRKLAPRILFE